MATALILGIGGQDGSYLADILVERGYRVTGVYRRSSVDNLQRIAHLQDRVQLVAGDLLDIGSIRNILSLVMPQEIYNEADQDHVGFSYSTPGYNYDITGKAVGDLLQAVSEICPRAKVFQPLSATMFGKSDPPQNEETPFNPFSPYACAKVFAYYLCRYYREYHGLHVSTAILFNHDSPRRSEEYLLNKICSSVARIVKGEQEKLLLGNLDLKVDIGHAEDYMRAAVRFMECSPQDLVIGSGRALTIREWADLAFKIVELETDNYLRVNPDYPRVDKPVLHSSILKAKELIDFEGGRPPREVVFDILRSKL